MLANDTLDDVRRCRLLITLVRETSSVDDPRCEPAIEASLALARELGDPVLIGIALTSASEEYPADIAPDRRNEIRAELAHDRRRSTACRCTWWPRTSWR